MKRRKLGLYAYGRLIRIDTHRQIIKHNIYDIIPDLPRVIRIVRKSLIICYQYIDIIIFSRILKFYTSLKGTHIMSQMKPSRRPVTRKYYLPVSLHLYILLYLNSVSTTLSVCHISMSDALKIPCKIIITSAIHDIVIILNIVRKIS